MQPEIASGAGIAIFVLFVLIGLVAFGLWLWSLIHAIMNKKLDDTMKIISVLLILFLHLLGSLIYVFLANSAANKR
ncbi:MAG: PLDc N-terminal domain-containing protein [Planctomycetota bacterium]